MKMCVGSRIESNHYLIEVWIRTEGMGRRRIGRSGRKGKEREYIVRKGENNLKRN